MTLSAADQSRIESTMGQALSTLTQYRDAERRLITLQDSKATLELRKQQALDDLSSFSAVKVQNAEDPAFITTKIAAIDSLIVSQQALLETVSADALQAEADATEQRLIKQEVSLIQVLSKLQKQYAFTLQELKAIRSTRLAKVTITDQTGNFNRPLVFTKVSETDYGVDYGTPIQ